MDAQIVSEIDPVVLVPGMLCDERVWAPVRARLAVPSFVVGIDEAATLGEMAEAILSAAPARFVLAGFSMGGMAALLAAERAPQRVAALAILSTHAEADTPERAGLRRGQIAAAQDGRFDELAAGLPALYFPDAGARAADSALILAMAHAQGPEIFARHVHAILERPDLASVAAKLDVPTEVLGGARDRVVAPEHLTRLAALIPGARLTLVPGCGHVPPLEAPEAVVQCLDRLCERSPA